MLPVSTNYSFHRQQPPEPVVMRLVPPESDFYSPTRDGSYVNVPGSTSGTSGQAPPPLFDMPEFQVMQQPQQQPWQQPWQQPQLQPQLQPLLQPLLQQPQLQPLLQLLQPMQQQPVQQPVQQPRQPRQPRQPTPPLVDDALDTDQPLDSHGERAFAMTQCLTDITGGMHQANYWNGVRKRLEANMAEYERQQARYQEQEDYWISRVRGVHDVIMRITADTDQPQGSGGRGMPTMSQCMAEISSSLKQAAYWRNERKRLETGMARHKQHWARYQEQEDYWNGFVDDVCKVLVRIMDAYKRRITVDRAALRVALDVDANRGMTEEAVMAGQKGNPGWVAKECTMMGLMPNWLCGNCHMLSPAAAVKATSKCPTCRHEFGDGWSRVKPASFERTELAADDDSMVV